MRRLPICLFPIQVFIILAALSLSVSVVNAQNANDRFYITFKKDDVFSPAQKKNSASVDKNNIKERSSVEVRFSVPISVNAPETFYSSYRFTCYVGDIKDLVAHGTGTLFTGNNCDGEHRFTGSFINGLMEGPVIISNSLGLIGRGYMKDGKWSGLWSIFDQHGVIKLSGYYDNGIPIAGPVIRSSERNLPHIGRVIYRQHIGIRDSLGIENLETIPVAYDLEKGNVRIRLNGDTVLLTAKNGDWQRFSVKPLGKFKIYTKIFELSPITLISNLDYSGPCAIYNNGVLTESDSCKYSLFDVEKKYWSVLPEGSCRRSYLNGHILDASCKNGSLTNGKGHLKGPNIDSQYVNIVNGSYEWYGESEWDELKDKVPQLFKDNWYLAVAPFANPDAFTDVMQEAIGEANIILKKNPDIGEALEKICGPKTGGCTIIKTEFDGAKSTSPSQKPNNSSKSTRSLSIGRTRLPAADNALITSVSVGNVHTYQPRPLVSHSMAIKRGILPLAKLSNIMFTLSMINLDRNKIQLEWQSKLSLGESVKLDCLGNSFGLHSCVEYKDNVIRAPLKPGIVRHYFDVVNPKDFKQESWLREQEEIFQKQALEILEKQKGLENNSIILPSVELLH